MAEDVIDEGEASRGASTISMQVTKNLFLFNGRSYLRKGFEIPLALMLDLLWSKRRMMEVYLNVAEFGNGIYGAEAAARHYFGRSAKNLSAGEAARIAATLPNPKRRNPANPSGYVAGYAASINGKMWQQDVRCTR